jgi:putative transposase
MSRGGKGSRAESQRDWDEAHLINVALDAHHEDPAFGYRFIADELRPAGITAGDNRVARLCSQQQIWSVFSKKRGLNRRAGPPVETDEQLIESVGRAVAYARSLPPKS